MRNIYKNLGILVLIVVFATIASAATTNVLQSREDRIWIGSDGTEINLLGLYDVAFAGATSATATTALPSGATYFVVASWKTSSADPGKVTTAVSGGTLTVTTANSTTGTCSVAIFGAP